VSEEQPIDLEDLQRVSVKVREMTDDNWLADMVEIAHDEIARLREERRWVSVGERLPDDLRRVMVMAPGLYGAQVAWLLNGKWHDGIGYPCDAIDCRVTHWMPLPPGPEGNG
jgi:hypothetical protein